MRTKGSGGDVKSLVPLRGTDSSNPASENSSRIGIIMVTSAAALGADQFWSADRHPRVADGQVSPISSKAPHFTPPSHGPMSPVAGMRRSG
jgi:hypothetical protein